ncbi:MAG: NnrS family protein [Burkholderiaceae bacterium]|nr:NnrS family protein [Burkholderiaceae bacterium]
MTQLLRIQEPDSRIADRPSLKAFLELGFRPLYMAGALWALVAIFIWIFFPQLLLGELRGVIWHAHEMLWGFVITIAIGFLMTAGANWTGINPLSSTMLGLICALWLAARLGFLLPGPTAFGIAATAEIAMLLVAAIAMGRVVWLSKSVRNYGVPFVLLGMAAADVLFLTAALTGPYEQVMRYFHVGLILMAMLVLLIGRRVIPFFTMRATPGLEIPSHMKSGHWQLGASVLAVLALMTNFSLIAALLLMLTGVIGLIQVMSWRPLVVRQRPILWILYLGYFMTAIGLIAAGLRYLDPGIRAAWSVHTMAMGGFSVLIIGMITRTALGHLGRGLVLSKMMVISYCFMIAAVVLRLMAMLPVSLSNVLLMAAALCWIAVFALYVFEFFPWMVRARPAPQPIIPKVSVTTKTGS